MKLTAPGWTVSDHIFGKRKPLSPRAEALISSVVAALMTAGMFVGFIWVVKMIWMAV